MASDDVICLTSGLPGRYARALYSHAHDKRALEEAVEQMDALGRLIDQSEPLRTVLASPLLDIGALRNALLAVVDDQGFGPLVRNLVGVVAEHRRLAFLRQIVAAFAQLAAEKRGVQSVSVESAYPLSDPQRHQLRARLAEMGYTQVDLHERIEPALLGGLKVQIGARLYDTSLKSQLHRLQHAMKGAA